MGYQANETRYTDMVYSCCRNSGAKFPAVSLRLEAIMAAENAKALLRKTSGSA